MAVVECARHGVLQPYDMLVEQDGAIVVQCKMQVLLLPSGTLRITMGSLPTDCVSSERRVTDEAVFKLLNSSLSGKSKKKGKKAGDKKVHCCPSVLIPGGRGCGCRG